MSTVHCFFGCGCSVVRETPEEAHDRMEAHYRAHHEIQVALLLASVYGSKPALSPKQQP